MGLIHQFDVSALIPPLRELQLVQAVAKVEEYQSLVEGSNQMKKTPVNTLQEKQTVFIEFLRRKIKNWYDTMTPIPWKKSCKWTSSELFVTCRLILTGSKSKLKVGNIDRDSKLQYRDIFTHDRLKSETRIIIEGDPGSGKTMLSSQLAYDWSIGKISEADMIVFLPLRFVEDMSLFEAIKKFYIPSDKTLTVDDIQSLLEQASKAFLILDGYEEYNSRSKDGEPSEVVTVMKKEKLANCSVVLTSRSDFIRDLPECPMLRLGQFGEEERDLYIANIFPDNQEKQETVKTTIKNFAFLQDLCSSPLLFVFVVHNVEQFVQQGRPVQQERVGAFMKIMVNTLLSQCNPSYREGNQGDMQYADLSEVAFNGLCKGHQQLLWQKSFLDRTICNVKEWVESGILVVEESPLVRAELPVGEESVIVEGELSESKEDLMVEGLTVKGEPLVVGEQRDSTAKTRDQPGSERSKATSSQTIKKSQLHDGSLQIKFLHKIIQEYFAAFHISSILKHSNEDNQEVLLNRHLPLINPADLHYILRFTSYLCPDSCHLIMEHLLSLHRQEDGTAPEYIFDCIFLCFAEVDSSVRDKRMDNAVRQVCEDTVTILGEDSRLLQQSKVSMLTYATKSKIQIGTLKLIDVIVMAAETQLTFHSGIHLQCLPTVKSVEVSRWDHELKDENYKDLVRFIFKFKFLEMAQFIFPSPPPLFADKKDLSSMKKDLIVEWIIGKRIVHTLDKQTGKWEMQFRRPTSKLEQIPVSSTSGTASQGRKKDSSGKGKQPAKQEKKKPSKSSTDVHTGEKRIKIQQQQSTSITNPNLKDEESPTASATVTPSTSDAAQQFRDPTEMTAWSGLNHPQVPVTIVPTVTPDSLHDPVPSRSPLQDKFSTTSMVNTNGGSLSIPNTGVKLEIPPGALTCETLVTMRIILHQLPKEKKLCFESNSSVVVEVLPNKLELLKAAELTLPHCLVLKKGAHWTAKVYSSHHEEGSPPVWEEQLMADCKLNEGNAVISLSHFSWDKIEIDGKIVEGKRIVIFAAQRRVPSRNTEYVDVGYHLNLPGAQEVVMSNKWILLADQNCKFWKDGELPLKIEFEKTEPAFWNYNSSDEKNKEIPFKKIEESDSGYCPFVFKRKDVTIVEDCTCYFKAGQKYQMELVFPLQDYEAMTSASTSKRPSEGEASQSERFKGNSSAGYSPGDGSENAGNATMAGSSSESQKTGRKAEDSSNSSNITKLYRPVDGGTLWALSRKIGHEWREVGFYLRFDEGELDHFEMNNKNNIKKAIHTMLKCWKQENGKAATFRILGIALADAGRKDLQDSLYQRTALGLIPRNSRQHYM